MDDALEFFKDWSNYLLVTTVAALGWAATANVLVNSPTLRRWCIWSFALSIVFAIFTLALIPLVAEQRAQGQSIYDVMVTSYLPWRIHLKVVCLPQHILFIAGIIFYAWGAWNPGPASAATGAQGSISGH